MSSNVAYRLAKFLYIFLGRLLGFFRRPSQHDVWTVAESLAPASEDDWAAETLNSNQNRRLVIQGADPEGEAIQILLDSRARDGNVRSRVILKLKDFGDLQAAEVTECISKAVVDDGRVIVVGPVRLEIREPFRRIRVTICGIFRDSDDAERFVRLTGWWHATVDEHRLFGKLTASQFANQPFELSDAALLEQQHDFVQFGQLSCQLLVEDLEPREIMFESSRLNVSYEDEGEDEDEEGEGDDQTAPFVVTDFFTTSLSYGTKVLLAKAKILSTSEEAKLGVVFLSDRSTINVVDFSDDFLKFSFASSQESFETSEKSLPPSQEGALSVRRLSWSFDGSTGYGLTFDSNTVATWPEVVSEQPSNSFPTVPSSAFVLSLDHPSATTPAATGGKGSNLALIVWSKQGIKEDFDVPKGCVLTVAAFEDHLRKHAPIRELLDGWTPKLRADDSLGIAEFASEMEALLTATALSESVESLLTKSLSGIKGPFAVRSSAVGEDGAELSSAGQLETFLNVSASDVAAAVVRCWASNYRAEVVTYRLQHGQAVDVPVAVVVQAMVNGAFAGVLFTNDPVKGDPSTVVVNVVAGCGEALVSGQATPDSYVVKRQVNNHLQLIKAPEFGPLPEQTVLRLARIGIEFEKLFGGPQDVEFAIENGIVHILQSRAITNLDLESEWEFEHEFDAPTLSHFDVKTTANVGEVFPIPFTPLDDSLLIDLYDHSVFRMVVDSGGITMPVLRRSRSAFTLYRQRIFLNATEMCLRNWQQAERDPTTEYSLAGQRIFTPELILRGKQRFCGKSMMNEAYALLKMLHVTFIGSRKAGKHVEKVAEEVKALNEDWAADSIDEQLELIAKARRLLAELVYDHSYISMFSTFTYVLIAMVIRGGPEGDLTPDMLSDIASIFASNPLNPISSDVPKTLKALAKAIHENGHEDVILPGDDPEEVVEALLELSDETGALSRQFFETHGHRGFGELLLSGETWEEKPTAIVQNLKGIWQRLSNGYEEPEAEHNEGPVLDRLKSVGSLSGLKRTFLEYLIAEAHRGVYLREAAKSEVVLSTGVLRKACLYFGELLHAKRLLPEPRSILFLTFDEAQRLAKGASCARLIHRLRRRKKVYDSQAAQTYPLVTAEGHPVPKSLFEAASFQADVELKGTAVCEGLVYGTARIAKTLEEAEHTQPGEILITRYTDIAWSPLFPIIRGLVTEIGGLLSHGSVVAREYGLPCVIAVEGATDVFRTGDQVLIDSTRGVVKRIVGRTAGPGDETDSAPTP